MKIYVLGSNSFVKEMVARRDQLCALGHDGWIHQDYEDHVNGKKQAFIEGALPGESADFKRARDYIRQHYNHILKSDAILIVNLEKRGIKNYIGGNCLMEMGMAYVNNKRIFLLNDIPTETPYLDEIKAMDPICLHGNLSAIQ
ncbi:MAG: hypothetical protein ABSC29_02200 [Minisyncoccia bacterium]|jgi:hypothetical protein